MAGRRTNLALLGLLVGAFLTGWLAFGIGLEIPGRMVAVVHGVLGLAVLLLGPWKSLIVRRGLRRERPGRLASITFSVLVLSSILAGVGHSSGLVVDLGPLTAMQIHVGAALLAGPLAVWHVVARPVRIRPADLGRRNLLRAAGILGGGAALLAGLELAWRALGASGGTRRFTGSHPIGAGRSLPVTQWLDDRVPSIRDSDWSLTIRDAEGSRVLGLAALEGFDDHSSTVLDCTGGWYAERNWQGARLDRLITPRAGDRSLLVWSATGYRRRLPIADLPALLLATRLEGAPLPSGNGFPARLVAPGRRGFWWVKWVVGAETSAVPWWLQLPFPLT